MKKIPILGVIVGRGQVQIETNKVKAVKEWKTSTKIKEVESFLGFANFYRQFIKNFNHMARFLNKLKGKKEWKWGEEQQEAFGKLKEKINSKWKPIHQSMQLEESYHKNKTASGNLLHFYQE